MAISLALTDVKNHFHQEFRWLLIAADRHCRAARPT